jgi:shikimate kinase / 3-dehydroquinate synthase
MGAGKSTLGPALAERLGRSFVDVDHEIEKTFVIRELFEQGREDEFRAEEARVAIDALTRAEPAVIALGGGAVENAAIGDALRVHAFTVALEVDVETAWRRSRESDRPLARDEAHFRALYARRAPLYEQVSDACASDLDGALLAAAGVELRLNVLDVLGSLLPEGAGAALVTDPHVGGIHGAAAQVGLGDRLLSAHEVPVGEDAKTVHVAERLWRELRLPRNGVLVALGGGCVTDLAGFVAATYMRGVQSLVVPTTLVAQVDAAIGGKTAIDLPEGKNLVGAFNWNARTVIDPGLLETLPEKERREGMAEVVKTGLLAGEPFWELGPAELVRRTAAFKAGVCVRDPFDRGERAMLNLGHTFAHALEAAAAYRVTHGQAVALGLLAALRLSGRPTDIVEQVLAPRPVRVDRDVAWAALQRDKKALDGEVRVVLLTDRGPVVEPRPAAEVRAALDELIAE